MAKGRKDQVAAIINTINSIGVGELSGIETKLRVAGAALEEQGFGELKSLLEEAHAALGRSDLASFRRLLAQAVARLGHVK